MCISWNSWWRCSIARTSKVCLDWHQKSDFELNSYLHLRHSCNQNMQNIVTWGQNLSANIEEFACISMGGLFSGVPPHFKLYAWLYLSHLMMSWLCQRIGGKGWFIWRCPIMLCNLQVSCETGICFWLSADCIELISCYSQLIFSP